jgi:two-component system sensor histidine kinase AtoS
MFSKTDYDKLQQIMEESPQKRDLLTRLLESHQTNLSMVSHEIRNPLTLVYGTLQLIESQHPEAMSFAHWNDMRQDLEYMIQLLDELSSYNNGNRLNLELVDTSTYLKKIALSFAGSLTDTGIEFRSCIDSMLPPMQLDTIKFKQALLNLLKNAVDATNETKTAKTSHSITPSITLNATKVSDSELIISISDTGCGMNAECLNTIFQPFVTHKENGTGLGLAITERIIHAHHGSIQVESAENSGTIFLLRLPVQQNT